MAAFDFLNPLQGIKLLFTDDQIQEITDWFDENAKSQLLINDVPTNAITIEQLIVFLGLNKFHRRNFHYPNYGEIMTIAERLKAGITRMLTKDQVLYMMNQWVQLPNLKHELKLAFKVFDTENRGYLDIDDINDIVTGYGDPFNVAEVREIIRDANVRGDGYVYYEDFVETIFSLAPELKDIIKAEYIYEDPDEDPSVPPLPEPEPKPEAEEPRPPPSLPTPPAPPPAAKKKKK